MVSLNSRGVDLLPRRQFMKGVGVAMGAIAASAGCAPAGRTLQTDTSEAASSAVALDAQTLDDALVGSSYMGCGGGGSLQAARELLAEDLAAGLSFLRLPLADLGDRDRVASPYALESLAPIDEAMQARLDRITPPAEMPTVASFRLLEDYLQQKFSAVIIGEIGPLSMAEALSLGARIGVPSLDADTVGRATPEINQHSVRVAGHAITPAAAVTQFGDELILRHVADPSREEDVFRAVSVVSRLVGVTDAAITGAVAKSEHVLVDGSLSQAIAIGKAVREAQSQGDDPVDAARRAGDGYLLFEGVVQSLNWADRDGFLVGDATLIGVDAYRNQILELDYKNEHLVARLDGKTIATCPDLITMVDRTTFEGIGNPDFEKGQRVAVLGYRAPALWRRKAGLEVFSPRYFGYDVDYVPIERRVSTP